MEEQNPYQSPRAAVSVASQEGMLASRGARLAAALLDGLIGMAIMLPMMFVSGYFGAMRTGETAPIIVLANWALIGCVVFVLVQGYPLHATGQTWGKRALGIRIVSLDGTKPALGKLLLLRYLPLRVVGVIPLVNSLVVLTDALLIFRNDRRCLHDLIAGTRVVVAR